MGETNMIEEKKKRRKKRRGLGAVRWREDIKKYVIDYYDRLGKRHIETVGTNMHDAADLLHEKMDQIKKGSYNPGREEKTFKDFAEKWLEGKLSVKEATRVSYQGIVNNHLIPCFGDGIISNIKREDIKSFVKGMVDGGKLTPKSIHNILLVLHQILDDAQVEGLVIRNPYVKIEKPKRERPEVDYLKTFEIPIFLKAAQSYKEPKQKISKITDKPENKERPKCETTIHALFYTAIFSGTRRGEFLGLKWEDIDGMNSRIHVRRSLYKGTFQTPKSDYSKRAIDMGPRLVEVLKDHRAKQNETRLKVGTGWNNNDLVFCQDNGTAFDADNLYHRVFKSILKKAGLRMSIRIHDLRHTYAAILISTGHNLKYIQSQMGHSSVKTTLDLYGHLMPEIHDGAAKKSEDFVFLGVSGNVMVTDKDQGVTTESQPLDLIGSGG